MTLSLLQSSPLQVIFNNCSGFTAYPTNATLVGLNVLIDGYTQNSITKTIVASGSGNIGQVLTSGGANGIDVWTTPEGDSGGGGVCLENINLYCKGQSYLTKQEDTLSIENVSEVQNITTNLPTYSDITGTTISYRPPTNTKLVIYTFQTHLSGRQSGVYDNKDCQFKCFLDGTEITSARVFISNPKYSFGYIDFSVPIQIGEIQNIANGVVSSWDALKSLKWSCSIQQEGGNFQLHTKYGFSDGGFDTFSPPKIKIEAFS
jgi:hypothetical protein